MVSEFTASQSNRSRLFSFHPCSFCMNNVITFAQIDISPSAYNTMHVHSANTSNRWSICLCSWIDEHDTVYSMIYSSCFSKQLLSLLQWHLSNFQPACCSIYLGDTDTNIYRIMKSLQRAYRRHWRFCIHCFFCILFSPVVRCQLIYPCC